MHSLDTPIHRNYSDGDIIINEGDMGNNAYVVIKGQVRITQKVNEKAVTWNSQGKRSFRRDGADLGNCKECQHFCRWRCEIIGYESYKESLYTSSLPTRSY
jgi:hypothetical protein